MSEGKKKKLPRGIRNNNPLNIRRTATIWKGMCEKQTDKEFCQFETMAYGWRAAFKLLIDNYYRKRRLRRISHIITRWAPPCDGNDTYGYIKKVADHMALEDEKGNSVNDAVMPHPESYSAMWWRLAWAMGFVENGVNLDLTPLREGWQMYWQE